MMGFYGLGIISLTVGLLFGMTADSSRKPGKVLGIAFESLRVSNLKKSVEYYQALGFKAAGDVNPPWTKDAAANRLYKTPGAESRTATLTMSSTASGQPFMMILREYKNIARGNRIDFPARNPSQSHIGVVVPEADSLWEQLRSSGMLRPLSWEGKLIRMPNQTSGGLAYVRDPDGWNIEIIGIKQPGVQTAQPTLHHVGLSVLNSEKSIGFYGGLLGAEFPKTHPDWVGGDMYDAVVGGHGYFIKLINGTFPEMAAPKSPMRFELVEYKKPDITKIEAYSYSDIAVSCVGLQVDGLEELYPRLKTAGVDIWSEGGIVQQKDGTRAVVIRDPDVGAFVELFEK
jgi:catechol 2,3-dioxygenase-like lactoylglutathione lyase family enzyme